MPKYGLWFRVDPAACGSGEVYDTCVQDPPSGVGKFDFFKLLVFDLIIHKVLKEAIRNPEDLEEMP